MIDLLLEDIGLYKLLDARSDRVAKTFAGVLIPIASEAGEVLERIRITFPTYTRHNIQHSLKILENLSKLLGVSDAGPDSHLKRVSSAEIALLILAAFFHDAGMARTEGSTPVDTIRKEHHHRGAAFVKEYLATRAPLLAEDAPRLTAIVEYAIKCHNLSWEDMEKAREFYTTNSVFGQSVRPGLLAVLLRIGDLLDLDGDRACSVTSRFFPEIMQDDVSRAHYLRHRNVTEFFVGPRQITVTVECGSRQEHQIWETWLGYLRQDIEKANTYYFIGERDILRLPVPKTEVQKSPEATYEIWSLKFQIDPAGRLWDILSQSLYTGEFDYIREILQNSIDATLRRMFDDPHATIDARSPRRWVPSAQYAPSVLVSLAESGETLVIRDNGVGMDKQALKSFLFQVAGSNYASSAQRGAVSFPSIAKFGVGFISILTRVGKVTIHTRSSTSDDSEGRKVSFNSRVNEAFVDSDSEVERGTTVVLSLKTPLSSRDLIGYIERVFRYTSVPITLLPLDRVRQAQEFARNNRMTPPDILPIGVESIAAESVDELIRSTRSLGAMIASIKGPAQRKLSRLVLQTQQQFPHVHLSDDFLSFSLGQDFMIIDERAGDLPAGSAYCHAIWVAVSIDQDEIEWSSVHGFCVKDGEVVNAVLPPLRVSRIDDDDLYGSILDPIDEELQEDDDSESLATTPSAIIVHSSTMTEDIFSIESFRHRKHTKKKKGTRLFDEVLSARRQLADSAYQDGILLPVSAAGIVPLGACSALANFTAGSRLALNVSRNALDENPAMIDAWFEGPGRELQNSVISRIQDLLERVGVSWDIESLCCLAPDETAGIFARTAAKYARLVMRDLRRSTVSDRN